MATTLPTVQKSRIKSLTQAVMPSVQMASQVILGVSVMDAARKLLYPDLSRTCPGTAPNATCADWAVSWPVSFW